MTVSVTDAPPLPDHEQHECELCEAEDPFVKLGHDKVCANCGYVPGEQTTPTEQTSEWRSWWTHRSEHYAGFTGPERIRMPGGFPRAYDFESDF